MPYYESVFIARQDISGPQAEALTDGFAKLIEDQGGQVAKREYWGLRSLAYRIKKNRKGHYMLFNIDGPAGAVQEMERQMRLHEDVLRYLTIRVDALEEGPSMIMQGRSGRDDRRRDDRPRRDSGSSDRGGRDDRPRRDSESPTEAKATSGDDQGEKAADTAADAATESAAGGEEESS